MRKIISGIYKITNTQTNKCYIGQSSNVSKRFAQHLNALKKNRHHSMHLQNSFNFYGEKAFTFEIIEMCPINILNQREKHWIKYYDSFNNGYNMSVGGETTTLGYKYTDEQRKAKSESRKGKCYITAEGLKRISIAHKGKIVGKETRKKISEQRKLLKGSPTIKHTKESIEKIIESNKNTWSNEELKKQHSERMKIIENNPDVKKKNIETNKSHWDSNRREWYSKMMSGKNNGMYGKHQSKESKAKISKATIGENNPANKMTEQMILEGIKLIKNGMKCKEFMERFNVSRNIYFNIKAKKTWLHKKWEKENKQVS